MMEQPISLRALVKQCTVRLLVQGIGQGTGFFVAPGLVLTCAHVIEDALARQLPVDVHTWDGQVYGQTLVDAKDVWLENIPLPPPLVDAKRVHKYPDLAFLRVARRDHPCVYLAETVSERDALFSYGYVQDYASGEEVQLTYEGEGWIDGQRWLLKCSGGEVAHGLSGGPLVNERTGGVCGIIQRTRGAKSDLGGRALPVQAALTCFPELSAWQQQFHQSDQRWLTSLTLAQRQELQHAPSFIPVPPVQASPPQPTDPTIVDIARQLQRRKALGYLNVLFLGARTSGLYDNRTLYAELNAENEHFATLSAPEKFRTCYTLLQRSTTDTIHDILQLALKQASLKEADQQIAELVREGYFEVVISTALDVALDQAMNRERLLTPAFDSHLVAYDGRNSDVVIREERNRSKVIKIFGNLENGHGEYYTAHHELELDAREHTSLKAYLQNLLLENTLIIGYDPVWDRPLERAFLERQGKNLFYVNEEPLAEHTDLARTIQKRQGTCVTGEQGAYAIFIKQLYQLLLKKDQA